MSELERVLREFESATAAVATVPVEDFAEAKAAMDRRSWAIADLSALATDLSALTREERDDALRRLRLAFEAGEKAAQRLAGIRNAAAVEWNQWKRVYRALGAEEHSGSTINCRG